MSDRYASLKQGLVGCWIPSVSGSGLLLPDLSGRGNNGALTNMDASDWVSGQYGRELDFDGSDDRIVASGNTSFTNGVVSVSGWMRRTGTAGQNNAVVFSKGTLEGNANSTCALYWNEVLGWSWFIVDAANNLTIVRSNTVTSQNQWVHVAGIASSAGLSLYLNGSLANVTTGASVKNSSHSSFIGGADTGGAFASLLGQADDVRAYNRALTDSEIRLLASEPGIGFKRISSSAFATRYAYKPPKPRNYSVIRNRDPNYSTLRQGLVAAYCPSISGQGNVLPDLVGGNHGTLTNMDASDWVSSGDGRALDFDGVDDEVRATAPKITDAYCVSVWVKATTGAGSGLIALSQDGSNLGADLYINANGTIVFYCPSVDNGSSRSFFTTTSSITSNQWVHVVGRWRAGLINDIYVNGVSAAGTLTGSVQGALTNRTILSLGSRQGVNSWLTGQLDDAKCYNRLLTEPEIKLLASKRGIGLQPRKPKITFADLGVQKTYSVVRVKETDYATLRQGLVGAWCPSLPSGGSGNTLPDVSGYNNHGTLTNMSPDDWVSGQYGRALDFDNSNDFITLPSVAYLQNNQPFTLSWWERVTANTNTFPARFRLISATNTFAVIRSTSAGYENIAFGEWRNVAGLKASGTSLPNSIGKFFHFSIVGLVGPNSNSATDFRVYENATSLTLSASNTFSSFAGSVNQIGWDSLDNGADCLMDDIRIYSRALTESEIKLLASRRGIGLQPSPTRFIAREKKTGLRRKILTGQT